MAHKIKLVIEISSCKDCPYCKRESGKENYDYCDNPKSKAVGYGKLLDSDRLHKIPDWCGALAEFMNDNSNVRS